MLYEIVQIYLNNDVLDVYYSHSFAFTFVRESHIVFQKSLAPCLWKQKLWKDFG